MVLYSEYACIGSFTNTEMLYLSTVDLKDVSVRAKKIKLIFQDKF